ncbi:hypothetical protein CsatB_009416 [Cannabis sativa]
MRGTELPLNQTQKFRLQSRLPSFCLSRIRPLVRVRSPPIQQKFQAKSVKAAAQKHDDQGSDGIAGDDKKTTENEMKPSSGIGRKIMVVVDSSFEAKGALQWALSLCRSFNFNFNLEFLRKE